MSESSDTADTMRERSEESATKLWLLVEADRMAATAVLAVLVFLSMVVLVSVLGPPLVPQLRSGDAIETMFATMIGAVVTATTLTVTIGQVVLSQEFGPLGDQHERMSNAMNVRSYIGEVIGRPSPSDPATFLQQLVLASEERAKALRDAASASGDRQFESDVDDLASSIIENAETVVDQLEGRSFGQYDVVSAALNFNYGRKIHEIERISDDHADAVDEDVRERLDDLSAALSLYAPAREHVKTLYFQWELINLSQEILYLSVPALVVSGVMLAVVEPASFPGSSLGLANIGWVVSGAFTFTLMPFLLLVAYIARLVTIAKRTLAVEPLILRDTD